MPATATKEMPINSPEIHSLIRKRIIVISLIVTSVTYIYYHHYPTKTPDFRTVGDKFAYVIQCNIPCVWFAIVLVFHILQIRVTTHQLDPLSNKDLSKIEVPVRVLTNTFEQLIISLFFQLTSATFFGNNHMKLIPACAFWFLLGRIAFWYGYNQPANYRTKRGIGFTFTLASYIILAVFCLFMYLRDTFRNLSILI